MCVNGMVCGWIWMDFVHKRVLVDVDGLDSRGRCGKCGRTRLFAQKPEVSLFILLLKQSVCPMSLNVE